MRRFVIFFNRFYFALRLSVACAIAALSVLSSRAHAQCALSCNQNLQVSLDQSGEVQVTAQMIAPNSGSSCPGALEVLLFNHLGQPLANPLTCAQVGQVVTAQVRHIASGNSCSGTLVLRDALPPAITCSEAQIWCFQEAEPALTGSPDVNDNCTPAPEITLTYTDTNIDLPCGTQHNGMPVLGRINRSWRAVDEANNSSTCVQQIWLKHITLQDISWPPNRDDIAAPGLDCAADPLNTELTGQPNIEGIPIEMSPSCEFGITYTDQVVNFCPPTGYTVLRSWSAVDFCAGAISSRIQIIKVRDLTPPQITPPADITLGTSGFTCNATVNIPQATATDNCSAIAYSCTWAYGNGYQTYNNIPVGTHTITHIATDACGNSATATSTISIIDNAPPQALCISNLQVSLASNGQAILTPAALNLGSFDNCGPVFLAVSRDGQNFSDHVSFSCLDKDSLRLVTLRVLDTEGLENLCESEVLVRDFLKPLISCPADITLNCLQDHENLSITGQAQASDNCGVENIDYQDVVSLTACNTGTVIRTWTAGDQAGNTKTCSQKITLSVLSIIQVGFPANLTLNGCTPNLSTLPASTGAPQISGQSCSPLSITYTDEVFTISHPACFQIVRRWKVIDWCVYEPSGGASGIWQHAQQINVIDQQGPQLSIPADVVLDANQAGCMALVNIDDAVALDCSADLTLSHNSPYASNPGANASGIYPTGEHLVVFTASDGCGNQSVRTMKITVMDLSAPAPVCINGLSVNLGPNDTVSIAAALIDAGSYDLCSPATALVRHVQPAFFTCQQLGYQNIILSVSDEAGNAANCIALVNVQDNNGYCQGTGGDFYSLGGRVTNAAGTGVATTALRLDGLDFDAFESCDSSGFFYLPDVPEGTSADLIPALDTNWINGVSTFDLLLISKHILGIAPLDSPYKLIAADANRSKSITTLDIVELRKVILGITDLVPGNTSWRFVPSDFVFPNVQNPFQTVFPEKREIVNLAANRDSLNFIGIKIGDINGNANASEPRNAIDSLDLFLNAYNKDAVIVMPELISAEGLQFELNWDTTILKTLNFSIPVNSPISTDNIYYKQGSLRLSWHKNSSNAFVSDTLLLLHNVDNQDIASIHLNNNYLKPEVYFPALPRMALRLKNNITESVAAAVQLFPNPASDHVFIQFNNVLIKNASVKLMNLQGQLIEEKIIDANLCCLKWRKNIPTGLYLLEINNNGIIAYKKLFINCGE